MSQCVAASCSVLQCVLHRIAESVAVHVAVRVALRTYSSARWRRMIKSVTDLQCVAVCVAACCSVLQRVAVCCGECCNMLQCVAVRTCSSARWRRMIKYAIDLQCVAVCCRVCSSVLQHVLQCVLQCMLQCMLQCVLQCAPALQRAGDEWSEAAVQALICALRVYLWICACACKCACVFVCLCVCERERVCVCVRVCILRWSFSVCKFDWNMTHFHVWHGPFICVNMSQVSDDWFVCANITHDLTRLYVRTYLMTWLVCMCKHNSLLGSFVCANIILTWLVSMCGGTHFHVWYDWFICEHDLWRDSLLCANMTRTWLIFMCDVTHIHVRA